MKKFKTMAVFTSGFVVGAISVKKLPDTYVGKCFKFAKQVVESNNRLKKIVVEEYHRIDEAIASEQGFLNFLGNEVGMQITFEVVDKGDRRVLRTHLSNGFIRADVEGS